MDEEREPEAQRTGRRWLAWALVACAAAAGLWLAALPLDEIVPEPRPRRSVVPAAPSEAEASPEPAASATAETPRPAPVAPAEPEADPIDPVATGPAAEWVAEDPATAELRARLERQLGMNDLGGVRVEIDGDRVVTSGALARPGDRQRVELLVRSLAPGFEHEDRTVVAP